jgi:hypothetical protein
MVMKKLLVLSAVLSILGGYSANAQFSVSVGQPVYVERPVVYYPPSVYTPGYIEYYSRYPTRYSHGRRDNVSYWAREHERRRWEHERRHHHGRRGHR